MKLFALGLAGFLLSTAAGAAEKECPLTLGEAVPRQETARLIAEAVIAARQSPENGRKYQLIVEPDSERPDSWIAFQSLPRRGPGQGPVMGGGGISLRIDRCTGAISDMHLQR